ncbi:MAG: hypothetical protein PHD11_03290 [Bacteroidales bacterium]|nr:hypothetical protein [Bacteroidales bacterium]MDD4669763.1 hypothetical protein [Bacteroidales bacterium]
MTNEQLKNEFKGLIWKTARKNEFRTAIDAIFKDLEGDDEHDD